MAQPVEVAKILLPILRRCISNKYQTYFDDLDDHLAIHSESDLEYRLFIQCHNKIIDWLNNDCVWQYNLFTPVIDAYACSAKLIFNDIQGSFEFRLRFVE